MPNATLTRALPARASESSSTTCRAWVAKAPKQPMKLEDVDLGPLGPEEVEIAVEHCGLCHSDLSILNNDWGITRYPAVLGHEAVGRITALGSSAKGLVIGQRAGIGGRQVHFARRPRGADRLGLRG